jgi:putative DNA primase/helicase
MRNNPISSLEDAAQRLVHQLGGRWHRHGAMCHCPAHEDRTPSLSVRLGRSSLLFKCFAGCETLDVLRSLRALRLAIPTGAARNGQHAGFRGGDDFADRARDVWNGARLLPHTLGARYLAGRGILSVSPAVRYHAATPLGRGTATRFRPALIAGVRQGDLIVAIQRLFLARDGSSLAPDLMKPKLTLGRPLRGAVQLAPPGAELGLAEGIESALSAIALLGMPVWATLGGERLPHIEIPSTVRRLVLLPDADRSGRIAERKARAAYASLDLDLETIWPWFGLKDWNDVLMRQGGRGNGAVRHAA